MKTERPRKIGNRNAVLKTFLGGSGIFAASALSSLAVTISLPSSGFDATSPDAELNPTLASVSVGGVLGVSAVSADIDTANQGVASAEGWDLAASGGTSITLVDLIGTPLAEVDLNTQTAASPSSIDFNSVTTTSGTAGALLSALNLGDVVTAGLVQNWSAVVNLSSTGVAISPLTTYELSFDLSQSTSLLGNISPAVLNDFNVTVGDDSGTYGFGALPAGLLGITDLGAASGTASLMVTTGPIIDGDVVVTFSADATADTDLLDGVLQSPSTTVYSVSGLDITAVPEPGATLLVCFGLGAVAIFRRRTV